VLVPLCGVSTAGASSSSTAYVANGGGTSVTPIEVATNTPGPEIKVGISPRAIAITPDGKTAYVANFDSNSVTPIEVATNTPGPEIKVAAARMRSRSPRTARPPTSSAWTPTR
jgi:YVTN family beta-propeller protein